MNANMATMLSELVKRLEEKEEMHTVDGKKGVWRTVSGAHIFITADGKVGPKGNDAAKAINKSSTKSEPVEKLKGGDVKVSSSKGWSDEGGGKGHKRKVTFNGAEYEVSTADIVGIRGKKLGRETQISDAEGNVVHSFKHDDDSEDIDSANKGALKQLQTAAYKKRKQDAEREASKKEHPDKVSARMDRILRKASK